MTRSILLLIVVLAGALIGLSRPIPAGAQEADFGAFVGLWTRHGFGVRIESDGSGTAGWRIYRWCSDDPTPPCDTIEMSLITSGGRAALVFFEVDEETIYGEVIESTDPETLAPGPVALMLLPYGMALLIQDGRAMLLCGPDYVHLAPQDLRNEYPCGA